MLVGNGGIALELAHSLRGVEVGVVLGVCSMAGAHHLCLGSSMCRGIDIKLRSSTRLLLCRLCVMTGSHGCPGPGRHQAAALGTLPASHPSLAGEPSQLDTCPFLAGLQVLQAVWATQLRSAQATRGLTGLTHASCWLKCR